MRRPLLFDRWGIVSIVLFLAVNLLILVTISVLLAVLGERLIGLARRAFLGVAFLGIVRRAHLIEQVADMAAQFFLIRRERKIHGNTLPSGGRHGRAPPN